MLVIISSLLLVLYVIPLPLILLCPSKVNQLKCTKKFKPVFDAFNIHLILDSGFGLEFKRVSLGIIMAVWFYMIYLFQSHVLCFFFLQYS